jgi:hypothetical protein
MRPTSAMFFFCLLVLQPGLAHGEPVLVAVGKESTWVNLDTGERRIQGRRVRRVEIDKILVREKCDRVIDSRSEPPASPAAVAVTSARAS